MVSAVDLLPTLLEIADVADPPQMDGRSFAAVLRGGRQTDREMVFKEYNENAGASRDPMRGVQTKRHLYLFNPWSNGRRLMATATTGTATYRRMAALAANDPTIAARHELYRHRVVEELYDVQRDPDCLHNLIAEPEAQAELQRLRAALQQWMAASGDHLLEVYQHREDAQIREAYMQRVEGEAEARKARKRPRRKANPKPNPKSDPKRQRQIK
jgi:N-sulfoglucosamine sulfohydrolase